MDILFCDQESNYKKIGQEVYDINRNALTCHSTSPAIYHPPCKSWSRLKHFAKFSPGERWLGVWAVIRCRKYGGIVEQPDGSNLFKRMNCALPGNGLDQWGGQVIVINQVKWGHVAQKRTMLYLVGFNYPIILTPPLPNALPSKVIAKAHGVGKLPWATKKERSYTPLLLCITLVHLIESSCHHSFIGTQS